MSDTDEVQVPAEQARALAIIQLALLAGVFAYAVVVVILTRQPPAQTVVTEAALKNAQILSGANAFVALQCFGAAFFTFRMLSSPDRIRAACPKTSDAAALAEAGLNVLRAAIIVRAALLEAPALFSLTVIFLSHGTGVLAEHSWVWLNLIPVLIFFGLSAASFVTPERLQALLRERLAGLAA
ncbi:MAG: hypothetical protein AB7N76_04810 [Planctomycetota bacterium]